MKLEKMLRRACDKALDEKDLALQKNYDMEIAVHDTGDHAVEWVISYYTKEINQLPRLRCQLLAIFLEVSRESGISLSTPVTYEIMN